jgi:chromosome segregation ATPase
MKGDCSSQRQYSNNIMKGFDTMQIKEKLLELPETIKRVKTSIVELTTKLGDLKMELKRWELQTLNEIASEVDDKGKAIYSNEAKRQGRLLELQKNDPEYLQLEEKIKYHEQKINELDIELTYYKDLQHNLRSICFLSNDIPYKGPRAFRKYNSKTHKHFPV